MKKSTLTGLFLTALGIASVFGQTTVTGVSMTAQNKTVIMEEFTGVRCTYCPDGKIILDGILAQYPGQVYAVSFHPQGSGLTAPYAGDPDLRRTYPDVFYSTPYCGTSRFMPSSFINRRIWAGERLQGRGSWGNYVSQVMAEASPVNVGVLANYDSTTMTLNVTVEAYYTSDVMDQNALYVQLSEDGIVVQQQSGATGAFTQDKVFRQNIDGTQWGDAVSPTTMGSLVTKTYTWTNTQGYDMHKAKVIAYIENKTTQELYTGKQVDVQFGALTAVADPRSDMSMNIIPNPMQDEALLSYYLPGDAQVSYRILTLEGKECTVADLGLQAAGTHNVQIDATASRLAAGLYLVELTANETRLVQRIAVQ